MKAYEKLKIKKELMQELINIFRKYFEIEKVVVFGSRAQGCPRNNSDIDICIFNGSILNDKYKIKDEIENLYTGFSFDILFYEEINNPKLKMNIEKDGVAIYEKGKSLS